MASTLTTTAKNCLSHMKKYQIDDADTVVRARPNNEVLRLLEDDQI